MQQLPARMPAQSSASPLPHSHPDAGPAPSDSRPGTDLETNQLVSHLLATFPNLHPERTSGEIGATLRRIADSFDLDGCGVIPLQPDKSESQTLHYYGSGGALEREAPVLDGNFPWTRENLLNGNIVCFSSPSYLPQAAAVDRVHYEESGIHSCLAIPIYLGDTVAFFFLAHHARSAQVWRKETISLLRLIGELFVIALERCRDRSQAGARLQLEQLLPEVSARLINVTGQEVDREVVAVLKQVREILGFDRFGLLTLSADKRELMVTHAAYRDGVSPMPEQKDIAQLFPWARSKLLRGEMVGFTSPEELPGEAELDRRSWQGFGVKGNLTLPIHVAGSLHYLLMGSHLNDGRSIDRSLLPSLRLLGELCANALLRCRSHADCRKAREEIQRLEQRLQSESEQLQSEITSCARHDEIIGQSAPLARTLALTEQVAPTDSTVLILGETGTGKELVAHAIHKLGMRRNGPMVKVNCASLPASLVESELFGREKGAYTGALTRQAGRFELADGGTIFLDEIAEMSLELQSKLLRVLQEGELERLGSARTIRVDVRVIAATNRNLAEEVAKGNFREDLYYRLNVFPILVPPLRERAEDIPLLVWSFVQEFSEKMGKKINRISRQDMAALQSYLWPGNVRELRNVVEHAVIMSSGEKLLVRLPGNGEKVTNGHKTLEQHEIAHIQDALKLTGWRIKGEGGAARLLGLNPSTLYSRMQKYGISSRPDRDDMSP